MLLCGIAPPDCAAESLVRMRSFRRELKTWSTWVSEGTESVPHSSASTRMSEGEHAASGEDGISGTSDVVWVV
jgi:hypothetical protein